MIKLESSMLHIIQYEPVYILKPSQLSIVYCTDPYVSLLNGNYKYRFAYLYDFKSLESFLSRYNIYGGLVWDPIFMKNSETYFTMYLYYNLRDNVFRRVNILGYKCSCGNEGKSISAYDQYSTIGRQNKILMDKIGQNIDNETSKLCSKCGLVIYPIQHSYIQIEN